MESRVSSCWKAQKISGSTVCELEIHLVGHAAAAFDPIAPLAAKFVRHQSSLLRQGLTGCGGDFRQRQAVVAPSNHMTGAGDVDLHAVVAALEDCGSRALRRLRMERATVELKHQFSNFRASRLHEGNPCWKTVIEGYDGKM